MCYALGIAIFVENILRSPDHAPAQGLFVLQPTEHHSRNHLTTQRGKRAADSSPPTSMFHSLSIYSAFSNVRSPHDTFSPPLSPRVRCGAGLHLSRHLTSTSFCFSVPPRSNAPSCSHWQPNGWRRAERLPCIVYMHGNSSARVEALPQLSLALTLGATLVAFDFAGSGKSGGEHVSLGYYERDDLKVGERYGGCCCRR